MISLVDFPFQQFMWGKHYHTNTQIATEYCILELARWERTSPLKLNDIIFYCHGY